MIQLFLALTMVNLLMLGVSTTLGYLTIAGHDVKSVHILCGALSALVCVGVHCVVFTYFIATAKWIQHAVSVKQLDASLVTPTRSFRMQAFPAAVAAMAIVFIAAVLGAARDNYGIARVYHHASAIAALVVNIGVAIIEFRAIARNAALIDRILAQINQPPS